MRSNPVHSACVFTLSLDVLRATDTALAILAYPYIQDISELTRQAPVYSFNNIESHAHLIREQYIFLDYISKLCQRPVQPRHIGTILPQNSVSALRPDMKQILTPFSEASRSQ
jgi:hypothetical protein